MKVKQKNLFYGMLPSRKDKKKLLKADQGATQDGNPVDPRIKNMVKTLPDNYFDIFGGQPQRAQTPGIQPTGGTGPNVQVPINGQTQAPIEPLSNPGMRPPVQPPPRNHAVGNAINLGLMAIDAALPRERIHNQQVVHPQEGYQPYPLGTGSQALADGGSVNQGPRKPIKVSDPNDPRLKSYQDSLKNYDWVTNYNKDLIKKGWNVADPISVAEENRRTHDKLGDFPGEQPTGYTPFSKKNKTGGTDNSYVAILPSPVQPYEYRAEKAVPNAKRSQVQNVQTSRYDPKITGNELTAREAINPRSNYSFTGRDDNGQQTSKYFSDLDTWKAATDQLGYRYRETTNNGKEAHATGYQFYTGGSLMNPDRNNPIIIPEGTEDNMPSAAGGIGIPYGRTLQYEDIYDTKMDTAKSGNWIQGAVNPKHKGYCTPMTKKTCTPRRKAFAKTMKKHHGFHENGGIIPDNMSNFSPHKYEAGGFLEHIMYHPSAYDMQGYADGGSMRGGSDSTDMLENIFFHPSSQDMRGFSQGGSMGPSLLEAIMYHPSAVDMARQGKSLSPGKAREMLHDKTAHGHKLTDKQRKYFGAVASGYADMGLGIGGEGDPKLPGRATGTQTDPGLQKGYMVDDINYTLSHGEIGRRGGNNPLLMDALLWSKRDDMKGKAPQDIISSYYGRPATDALGAQRAALSQIGHGPGAMYNNTPDVTVRDPNKIRSVPQPNNRPEPVLSFAKGGIMYADGGNVETMWGGNVEQMSPNPNDGGTLQFNGASHDQGGIGMHYNGNPVEVEGGETAAKDSMGNLNIYGNMYLPGTRTKFKSVAKEIGEKEKRYDGLKTRGSELVNSSNPANKFERLSFNAGQAMMSGGAVGQRDLAEKKENLAHLQRAMLDTADEHGLDAQAMSMGNIKKAKKGGKARGGAYIPFAQDGQDISGDPNDPTRADRNKNPGNIRYGKFAREHGATGKDKDGFAIFPDNQVGTRAMQGLLTSPEYSKLSVKDAIKKWTGNKPYNYDLGDIAKKKVSDLAPGEFDQVLGTMKKGEGTRYGGTPSVPGQPRLNLPDVPLHPDPTKPTPDKVVPPGLPPIDVQQRPPLPTNAQPLGMNEVLGELYGAATNRVEPVPMQHYKPEMYTPYQVSFQDRLNENQNSFSALQRTIGATNPNALGAIAAQKYAADSGVKGEEFRTNQAISNDITNRNIALSNDAQLKNLGLADTQYLRQEGSRSKTREFNQLIVNSLSSKYAQNKLENTRLKLYENLYDYRFMPTEQGGLQATYLGPNAVFNYDRTAAAQANNQQLRTVSRYDNRGNLKGYTEYDDKQLKDQKDAMELEMQRRKLPLLTVPPL